ncbi:MAG: hypothetical protein NZL95_03140 [Chitinophagales bacterium]|nr:hypothetical protein [Chitinophagales bacterium]MDW8427526.1 hypothetical protein [Chitinophagales bacterium]
MELCCKEVKMQYRRFYSELGKLLYAIAAIDGNVQKKEYNRLREIVEKILVPQEPSTDAFGTDNAYYAEIEFDILMDQDASPEACFESFCSYVESHKTAFDKGLKNLVKSLAEALSKSDRGQSKKEQALIRKLDKRMKEIFG